jgi:hypothetical protein
MDWYGTGTVQLKMDHSYEEIRQTAIAVLAKQERVSQYLDLKRFPSWMCVRKARAIELQ